MRACADQRTSRTAEVTDDRLLLLLLLQLLLLPLPTNLHRRALQARHGKQQLLSAQLKLEVQTAAVAVPMI
jgi:hypothetical protein